MHHRCRRLAPFLLVPLLALTACNGDSDAEPPQPTASATTTPTPDPAPSPTGPVEPPVPDAMAKANKAGAKAFVEYYWDVVNYAQATGDVTTLETLGLEGCGPCVEVPKGIDAVYAADGWYEAGSIDIRIRDVYSVEASVGLVHIVTFSALAEPHVVHPAPEADPTSFGASELSYVFHVVKLPRGWRVSNWERGDS